MVQRYKEMQKDETGTKGNWGGAREGAGRKSSGFYGAKTVAVAFRISAATKEHLDALKALGLSGSDILEKAVAEEAQKRGL